MIEGRIIVSLGSAWDYDPTSKHQIMKILAERNRIVWVNYHGTRRPSVGKRDFRAACSTLRHVTRGIRHVDSSIVQVTPLVIPGAKNRVTRRVNDRMLTAQIRRAIRHFDPTGRHPVQVWSFAPDVPYLVGRFNEERFVYYCVDDYSKFDDFDGEHIRKVEGDLMDRADKVITTSEELFKSRSARRPDAALVRHGVDFDHFAQAWRKELPRPSDLASMNSPVFGFFGLIHHWVDVDLLAGVAKRRPDYTFVLIGDAKVNVSVLKSLPNVRLLGRRPYESLPAYCAAFDAGLMLFAQNEMTQNVNPIKMYEYLAAGLRVVSTPLPEARRYADAITFGRDARTFAEACDQVLARSHDDGREAVSRLVDSESWRTKVEDLSTIVMAPRGATTAPKAVRRERLALRGQSGRRVDLPPEAPERVVAGSAADD